MRWKPGAGVPTAGAAARTGNAEIDRVRASAASAVARESKRVGIIRAWDGPRDPLVAGATLAFAAVPATAASETVATARGSNEAKTRIIFGG